MLMVEICVNEYSCNIPTFLIRQFKCLMDLRQMSHLIVSTNGIKSTFAEVSWRYNYKEFHWVFYSHYFMYYILTPSSLFLGQF